MEYITLTNSASAIIVDLIGKNIASQALLDTSQKIYNTLFLVYSFDNVIINNKLYDVESQIKVIESLITDINTNIDINTKKFNSIQLCINNINDIINNVHDKLIELHLELEQHKTKWFYSYRTPNYKSHLDKLYNYKLQLDTRLDLLTKILTITKTL